MVLSVPRHKLVAFAPCLVTSRLRPALSSPRQKTVCCLRFIPVIDSSQAFHRHRTARLRRHEGCLGASHPFPPPCVHTSARRLCRNRSVSPAGERMAQ